MLHTCAWRQEVWGTRTHWRQTMRIVITLRTVFNLLIIAVLIGIAAGVYL
jgi:hypothetical protein